jgi:hypothetical protein
MHKTKFVGGQWVSGSSAAPDNNPSNTPRVLVENSAKTLSP